MNELDQNQFPDKNTGILIGQRPTDYVAGTLPYKVVVASGDWRPFVAEGEVQSWPGGDAEACVTFSHLNCLEVQTRQQGSDINLSDRFTAKMSGTTREGNYQYKVADSVRIDGVVLESDYPFVSPFDWNTYYQDIPAPVRAKVFHVDESYEWVGTDLSSLRYHLKHAPIQITIPGANPNHAVCLVYVDDAGVMYYFDSYPGGQGTYLKTMTQLPATAMKIVLNSPISMNQAKVVKSKNNDTVYICYPMPSMDYLNTKAQLEGFSVPSAIPNTDTL